MIHADQFILISIPVYLVILIIGIKKGNSVVKQVVNFIFFTYCVGVLSVTLFPLPVQKELIAARRELSYINMNYIPFVDIILTITGGNIQSIARIIGGNILLFVPLGSILPLIYKKANNLGSVVLCGLLASIVIETLQLTISTLIGFNYRSADINDLILNTLGTVIGFYLLKLVLSILKENFDVSHLYKT